MLFDLHIHSRASDGALSGPELLVKAAEKGLAGIAITDHDTVGELAVTEAYREEEQLDLLFIPGIELNTELSGEEVHILGYFIDYDAKELLFKLEQIRQARNERAREIVGRLCDLGYLITYEQVKRMAQGDVIARPHIALALIENGYVGSIREAFNKYIGRGCPAYVPRYRFSPEQALALIKGAQGITSLAHPGLIGEPALIEQVIEMGVEGLEVFYPTHTEDETKHFLQLAQDYSLLITGGSDFHGTGGDISRNQLGLCGIDQGYMQALLESGKQKLQRE